MTESQKQKIDFLEKLYEGGSINEYTYKKRKQAILEDRPMPTERSGCGVIALIIGIGLTVVFLIGIFSKTDNKKSLSSDYSTQTELSKKIFTLRLTHGMGKELKHKARLTCGDTPIWKLDYDNGESLEYTIISGSEYDPICGLRAKDGNGDMCEICISKELEGMRIRFDYGKGLKLVFDGYVE